VFCPRCGAEYRSGFLRCSDCDVALVDQLPVDPPTGHSPRGSDIDDRELVVVRTYPSVIDADLAKTALDAAGIDSMVRSDNEGGQSPGLAFGRGVELLVRADDLAAAEDMLDVEGIDSDDPEPLF
jgi:hypothetical protein